MNKEFKLSLDKDIMIYIQKLEYLDYTYKSIVSYMIIRDMYNTELFNYYFNKYLEYYSQYQLVKNNIFNMAKQELNIDINNLNFIIDYLNNCIIFKLREESV